MKVTNLQLKKIILEELDGYLKETSVVYIPRGRWLNDVAGPVAAKAGEDKYFGGFVGQDEGAWVGNYVPSNRYNDQKGQLGKLGNLFGGYAADWMKGIEKRGGYRSGCPTSAKIGQECGPGDWWVFLEYDEDEFPDREQFYEDADRMQKDWYNTYGRKMQEALKKHKQKSTSPDDFSRYFKQEGREYYVRPYEFNRLVKMLSEKKYPGMKAYGHEDTMTMSVEEAKRIANLRWPQPNDDDINKLAGIRMMHKDDYPTGNRKRSKWLADIQKRRNDEQFQEEIKKYRGIIQSNGLITKKEVLKPAFGKEVGEYVFLPIPGVSQTYFDPENPDVRKRKVVRKVPCDSSGRGCEDMQHVSNPDGYPNYNPSKGILAPNGKRYWAQWDADNGKWTWTTVP